MDGPTLEARFLSLVERMNIEEIENYRKKIRHHPQITELVISYLFIIQLNCIA
jgi:hypothetical protein